MRALAVTVHGGQSTAVFAVAFHARTVALYAHAAFIASLRRAARGYDLAPGRSLGCARLSPSLPSYVQCTSKSSAEMKTERGSFPTKRLLRKVDRTMGKWREVVFQSPVKRCQVDE